MNGLELTNFHNSVCFLPPNASVLLLGTGPSVIYNMRALIDYISEHNPIIIGINGYLKGLCTVAQIMSLHSEYYRDDVEMNKIPDKLEQVDLLLPDILFSNYLLQGEKCNPDGTLRPKNQRGDKYSSKVTEPLKDNLFYKNIYLMRSTIENNHIYLCCANNYIQLHEGKRQTVHYGQCIEWNYVRLKGFNLFPLIDRYLKRDIFDMSKCSDINLSDLFQHEQTVFAPMHGGEYLLSWLHANNPSYVAICGLFDRFKQQSKNLIRNWFWCKPARILPKNMLKTQSVIINLYRQEYGDRFIDLNLSDAS